jgi:hypothetical protein
MVQVAPDETARQPARRPLPGWVLWTGLALGVYAGTAAIIHRINLVPVLKGALGALVTFFAIIAAGIVFVELIRRHHRTVIRHGGRAATAGARHGGRAAAATARTAYQHGRPMIGRLADRVRSRWERRGELEDPADPDPAPAESQTTTQPPRDTDGGNTPMQQVSKIAPARRARRTAARTGGTVPSEWGQLIAQTADFEPEDDGQLLEWMTRQLTGLGGWAEALVDFYEHCTQVIGIDPKASTMLHDVADAAAQAAETMGAAKARFTEHYELPREFAGNGGLMTHDGRWITGEGA